MISATTFKSVLLDVLAAFLALGVLIASLVVRPVNDLLPFLMATAVLYFLVGLVRGKSGPANLILKGILIDSGGAIPVIIMSLTEFAFTASGYVSLFFAVSLLATICGVETRRMWVRGRRREGSLVASLSLGLMILALVALVPRVLSRLFSQATNRPAPSFSIVALDGTVVDSSDLKGRVTVLAFWATWCQPCINELPELQKVRAAYESNPKVVFWAINTGRGGDTVEKAASFMKARRLDLPCAFDSRGAANQLGVDSLPELILLDSAGRVRMIHGGYDLSEHLATNLSSKIESLLREPG